MKLYLFEPCDGPVVVTVPVPAGTTEIEVGLVSAEESAEPGVVSRVCVTRADPPDPRIPADGIPVKDSKGRVVGYAVA